MLKEVKPDELVIHSLFLRDGTEMVGPWELKQVPEPPCGELVFAKKLTRVPWNAVRCYQLEEPK